MADEAPKRTRKRRVKAVADTPTAPAKAPTPAPRPTATDALNAEIARLTEQVESQRKIIQALRPTPETHTEYRARKARLRMDTATK